MKLGGIEWRALALPATVVAAAVGIILWFNLIRVPAVEAYLHQAHLRVLRTVARRSNPESTESRETSILR